MCQPSKDFPCAVPDSKTRPEFALVDLCTHAPPSSGVILGALALLQLGCTAATRCQCWCRVLTLSIVRLFPLPVSWLCQIWTQTLIPCVFSWFSWFWSSESLTIAGEWCDLQRCNPPLVFAAAVMNTKTSPSSFSLLGLFSLKCKLSSNLSLVLTSAGDKKNKKRPPHWSAHSFV